MAHIAVNTRLLLSHRMEGISRFAYEVLKRMAMNNPNVQFSFFFDRSHDKRFVFGENVRPYVLRPQARHPLLWHAWFHGHVQWKLERLKPDLFFSPEFYLSRSQNIPQIATFHDLAYEHYPQYIGKWAARYCRTYSPIYARLAAHILTVSTFSKEDIISQYDIPAEKISVVHNGVSEGFVPISEAEKQSIRNRYTAGNPYIHFVGTVHPRKNIETLLRAFDHFKEQHDSPLQLLIIGRKGWKYEGAMEAYASMVHTDSVLFTGFVDDAQLHKLTAASEALCYVPVFEGFGIPPLEAMACKTPVICSQVSSLPEVVGEAALMISPRDIPGLSHAIYQLTTQPELAQKLRTQGAQQIRQFTWDKTYHKVWSVVEKFI